MRIIRQNKNVNHSIVRTCWGRAIAGVMKDNFGENNYKKQNQEQM
jgi:hypothetical protein